MRGLSQWGQAGEVPVSSFESYMENSKVLCRQGIVFLFQNAPLIEPSRSGMLSADSSDSRDEEEAGIDDDNDQITVRFHFHYSNVPYELLT